MGTADICNPNAEKQMLLRTPDFIRFRRCNNISIIHPLDPQGVDSRTVDVTDSPAGSVVRFAIEAQKTLLGVEGFAKRAELDVQRAGGTARGPGLTAESKRQKELLFSGYQKRL